MLDRWTLKVVSKPLTRLATLAKDRGYNADQVSVAGFCVGMMVVPALYLHLYWLALICIVVNRIGDGVDGCLARMTEVTDAGGYLDIVLDFIFYSAVVLGFALAVPEVNGLPAAALIFTFVGTGSSFLGFAIMAERRGIDNIVYKHKGFYYLEGLVEGTETIAFLLLFCLFPVHFPVLAYSLAGLCVVTVITRVVGGYSYLLPSSPLEKNVG